MALWSHAMLLHWAAARLLSSDLKAWICLDMRSLVMPPSLQPVWDMAAFKKTHRRLLSLSVEVSIVIFPRKPALLWLLDLLFSLQPPLHNVFVSHDGKRIVRTYRGKGDGPAQDDQATVLQQRPGAGHGD